MWVVYLENGQFAAQRFGLKMDAIAIDRALGGRDWFGCSPKATSATLAIEEARQANVTFQPGRAAFSVAINSRLVRVVDDVAIIRPRPPLIRMDFLREQMEMPAARQPRFRRKSPEKIQPGKPDDPESGPG